jgi:hypothetical protein
MNAALRAKVHEIEALEGETREVNLRYYHLLGHHVQDVMDNEDRVYGDRPMERLTEAVQIHIRVLRLAAQFARMYTEEGVQELIAARDEETTFAINWGHMQFLMTISDETKRRQFIARTLRNMWDPHALHAAIQRDRGETPGAHGRTHGIPKTIHMQIRQIMESTRLWVAKFDAVWNGDEYNVIDNILSSPPDKLEEIDLDNLDVILDLLPQLAEKAQQLRPLTSQARDHVNQLLQARAAAAAAEAETARVVPMNGRQARVIELGDGQARSTPRARRQRNSNMALVS